MLKKILIGAFLLSTIAIISAPFIFDYFIVNRLADKWIQNLSPTHTNFYQHLTSFEADILAIKDKSNILRSAHNKDAEPYLNPRLSCPRLLEC